MLNLVRPTDASWIERALGALDSVLLDHAHCEKKAAGAAIKLLFAYPHHRFLQEPLARLAREELEHFERLLAVLDERGIRFERQTPSPYGARLHALVRRREPERAIDVLLVAALIEARSCERMKLLADAVADPALAQLFRSLLACEARHHHTYLGLARSLGPADIVAARLRELAEHEAAIVAEPAGPVRLHAP